MKIIVGLSGGVDSSVAAYLLKKQGYDVEALYMQNWHDITGTLHGECEWEEERVVAEMVAKKIGIPFHFVDLSGEYMKQVADYMFAEYAAGRTPNPDVLCNSKIKFDAFLKHAISLGGDFVATGHYCKKSILDGNAAINGKTDFTFMPEQYASDKDLTYRIFAGDDKNKDQSYFLCQLSQEQLAKAIFPLGELTKPEVRKIAKEADLPSAEKKDSQGICFVGKVDLPVFLQQKLKPKEGKVVEIFKKDFPEIDERRISELNAACATNELNAACTTQNSVESVGSIETKNLIKLSTPVKYKESDGKVIGTHIGVQYYTIGQRHGLNIGGHPGSIFIIATDIESNTIYVGEGSDHPGLYRKGLMIKSSDVHWIRRDLTMKEGESREYLVRIRYRQPLQKATLYQRAEGLFIIFEKPQRSITPGQFAAWYEPAELEMLGSGVI
jgi:tRNA-uridine 2-sulfurtransferase